MMTKNNHNFIWPPLDEEDEGVNRILHPPASSCSPSPIVDIKADLDVDEDKFVAGDQPAAEETENAAEAATPLTDGKETIFGEVNSDLCSPASICSAASPGRIR